jgi:hypothetical protein
MADQPANDPNNYKKGADDRAHGTHGRGGEEEKLDTNPTVESGMSQQTKGMSPEKLANVPDGLVGEVGHGSQASGGSVVDQRSEKGRS